MPHNRFICSHCGVRAASSTHGDYGLADWGIPIVVKGIELVRCWTCGHQDPVILDVEGLMTALAKGLASSPVQLSDREAWFPRKFPVRSAG